MKQWYTEEQREWFETAWFQLVQEFESNLDKDPNSQVGIALGQKHVLG